MSPRRLIKAATAGIATIALVATLVVTGVQVALAATPTISVTPSTLLDGDVATIHADGFDPAQLIVVGVCPRSYADDGSVHADAMSHCSFMGLGANGSVDLTQAVHNVNQPFVPGDSWTCSALPDGCVIAAFSQLEPLGTATAFVASPITMQPRTSTISVTPSTVTNRGEVTAATAGFPTDEPGTIGLCPTSVTGGAQIGQCQVLASHPDGLPVTATVSVPYQFTSNGTATACWSCKLAAWTVSDPGPPIVVSAFAATAITVRPPTVTLAPQWNLEDGQTVTVQVADATPGPASVRQCTWWYADLPNGCTPATSFTVAGSGTGSVSLAYHGTLTAEDGTEQQCQGGCVYVVSTSDGPLTYEIKTTEGPPEVHVPFNPYDDGEGAMLTLDKFPTPGAQASIAQCRAGTSHCGPATSGTLDDDGGHTFFEFVVRSTLQATDGTTVDCHTTDCVIAGFGPSGELVASAPIYFTPATLTLSASTGLLHGDVIHGVVRGDRTGLLRVVHCARGTGSVVGRCEAPSGYVWENDLERVEFDTTAVQRLTTAGGVFRDRVCRDSCSIAVVDSSNKLVAEAPYTMTAPQVSATPSTGVEDGQTVTVTGTNLQPTYAGPTVLFPTGGWAVSICDASVRTNPSLVELFQRCAVPAGGATVDVPGSTSSTDVEVPATISRLLGGTTDCAASPGACVIGLSRWEQDGTVSAAFTPLSFT